MTQNDFMIRMLGVTVEDLGLDDDGEIVDPVDDDGDEEEEASTRRGRQRSRRYNMYVLESKHTVYDGVYHPPP